MNGFKPNKTDLTKQFEYQFSNDHLLGKYPILNSGLESGIVHWLFQSYYVILGNKLGYQPIVEYPFFDEEYQQTIGASTNKNKQKKSDVSWLNKCEEIKCAIEFEKYSTKPREKARNLVRYSEQQSDLDLIILHYWDTSSHESDYLVEQIKKDFKNGFDYHRPEADTILIETVFLNGTENGHSFTKLVESFPQK